MTPKGTPIFGWNRHFFSFQIPQQEHPKLSEFQEKHALQWNQISTSFLLRVFLTLFSEN